LAKQEYKAAAEAALEAARSAREGSLDVEQACSLLLAVAALRESGQEDASNSLLGRARVAIGSSSGEKGRFARPGSEDPAPRIEAVELLSAREREILHLVARGHRNAEIADELVLSKKTVENHLSRVFAKLGVSSRIAAATLLSEYERGQASPIP
jgi:DNA-binding NarL/FixJ family response regulator